MNGVSAGMRALLDRVTGPEYPAWKRQVERAGHCVAPVRVRGSAAAVDAATGEVRAEYASADQPDGTLLVACGDRRAAVCPPCAATYADDAWHMVASGVRGRDGDADGQAAVPSDVAEHPRVFATLTAPSFGAVHRASDAACRPRATGKSCSHGGPAGCGLVHEPGHRVVGTPLCADCYDYTGAVLWNAHAGELWRRTTIAIGRELARAASAVLGRRVSATALRDIARISYVKVAEFQKRGMVHFHVVARLDGVDPNDRERIVAPPSWASPGLLADAIEAAASRTELAMPSPDGVARVACWGTQRDIADVSGGWESGRRVARYLAKYATKTASESVGEAGALARRLHTLHVRALRREIGAHLATMVETAWKLGHRPELAHLRLQQWAHQLGYRGHFTTKSRRYSVTMGALRAVRRAWRQRQQAKRGRVDVWGAAGDDGAAHVVASWRYAGRGYVRSPDAHLVATMAAEAEEARAEVRAQKRVEREMRFWGALPVTL